MLRNFSVMKKVFLFVVLVVVSIVAKAQDNYTDVVKGLLMLNSSGMDMSKGTKKECR